jgi:CMP-N-acetylneuraminic acid synthetase
MTAIAATGSSSGYSAVAQLLADGLSNKASASGLPQIGQAGSSNASSASSSNPADSVDLSDHAKALLAQAQKDQVLASDLQTLLQSARNSKGASDTSASSQAAADGTQVFDQLTGKARSQQQANPASQSLAAFQQADGALVGLGDYAKSLAAASEQPDGTYSNYSQNLQDVVAAAPSTPQQVTNWYQTDGKILASQAQAWPENDPGLGEALASHSVTFLNAGDVPDLNFHNTISIQGGENGGSAGEVYTYNHNAAVFSDPTTSYKVLSDGIVLAWKTPPSSGATASS